MAKQFFRRILSRLLSCIQRCYFLEGGQAAVETAFSILFFLTLVLSVIQVVLIANAKLMVNYAAYSAARTGIVTGANVRMMRRAAALACVPLNRGPDNKQPRPMARGNTTSPRVIKAKLNEDLDYGLTIVRVVHPTRSELPVNGVIPFDSYFYRQRGGNAYNNISKATELVECGKRAPGSETNETCKRAEALLLTVQVTHFFKLEIPIINRVFAEFFPSQVAGGYKGIAASRTPWDKKTLAKNVRPRRYLDAQSNKTDYDKAQEQRIASEVIRRENRGGKFRGFPIIRIPLTSHYTMRMQTDLRWSNMIDDFFNPATDLPVNHKTMNDILKSKTPTPQYTRRIESLAEVQNERLGALDKSDDQKIFQ